MVVSGVMHVNRTGICAVCILIALVYVYNMRRSAFEESVRKSSSVDLNRLLDVAVFAALNGGQAILDLNGHMNVSLKGKTAEGVPDSVTTADLNSHCAMTQTISHFFPALEIISEEQKSDCKKQDQFGDVERVDLGLDTKHVPYSDVKIWIDPLDATKEYTEHLYKYVSTMVCVAVKGQPTIGVIHFPYSKTTYWAWVNKSVSENLRKPFDVKKNFIVVVSISHEGLVRSLVPKLGMTTTVISAAGAGYKAVQVAIRRASAYLHTTAIKKWDVCAGNAILNAMGGRMTTLKDVDLDYSNRDEVLNSGGILATWTDHDEIVKKLSS